MAMTSGLAMTPLVDEQGFMQQAWQIHFRETQTAVAAAPSKENITQLPPQTAGVGFGSLPVTLLPAGLYRLSVSIRIKVAAGVSSTLGPVTILWTDGGVACSQIVIPALATNTVATVGSGVLVMRVDYNTPIGYAVGYASNPAAAMSYELRFVLESLGGA